MFNFIFPRVRLAIPMVATLLVAVGCGGGVGSGGTGVVSGDAIKGPMNNATIVAYGITGGQVGARIGTATTDAEGKFTITIGNYGGPVMLQASGGSYTDEATGSAMTMAPGDAMTAVIPNVLAGATNSGVQLTPLTAMAQTMAQHMVGGMTEANIAAANTALGNNFSVSDILLVHPMNPLMDGSGIGVSQDARNYGMTLAAMSQYAQTLGLSTSSTMVTAMMNDATDGILDGKAGAASVQMGGMSGGMLPATAGTTGMGEAMNTFMISARNRSGVTTDALMNQLKNSSGHIQSGVQAMMNATVGGTVFNGPVSQATVVAFAINSGAASAQLASVGTDSQGNFTLPLGSYSGPVMLKISGASYTDEATNTSMTMAAGDFMSAALPMVASGETVTGVWVTPVTAMAQSRALGMSGGMTDANIIAANVAMGNYFSMSDILHTQPMNPAIAGSGASASPEARNYGMTLVAMSQYANTLNMTPSSALVTAMMNDASDGVMNGKMGATQISMSMGGMMGTGMMATNAGTSSLASAMTQFMDSSANVSGLTLTDMATFMQALNNSSGNI